MARKLPVRPSTSRGGSVRPEGSCPVAFDSEEGLGQRVQQGWEVSASHRRHQQQRGNVQST